MVVGVISVGAVAGAIAILQRPVLGAYVLVLAVPILSGTKRGFPVPGLRISEVMVVAIAALVLIPAYRDETQKWNAIDWLGFLYAGASVLMPLMHLVIRGEPLSIGSLASMFLPLQFFLLYRTVRTALPAAQHRRLALRLVLAGSVLVSLLAALQQFNVGPTRRFVGSLTASQALESQSYLSFARATGPFQHWHPLAGYLTVMILFCVALLLDQGQRIASRRQLFVVLGSCVAALMLSVTFVSMIGVVAGSLVLGYRYGRLQAVAKWGVAGAVIALLLFGSFVATRVVNQYRYEDGSRTESAIPQTVQKRLDVWGDEYLPVLAGRWVAGYGPDLPRGVTWTHTESVYVTLLLRGGLPLLFLFGASMWAVAVAAKDASTDEARRACGNALVALVAVLWFMQLLYPYFTGSGMPEPFWVLAGITLAGWQNEGVRTWTEPHSAGRPTVRALPAIQGQVPQ